MATSCEISIVDQTNLGRIIETRRIEELEDLVPIITSRNYSLSGFLGATRRSGQFKHSSFVGLDIDSGLPIASAKAVLKSVGIRAIVAPTKHHNSEKNGLIAERYRIVFPIGRIVTNGEEYQSILRLAHLLFPESDSACLDLARFYFPSTSGEYIPGNLNFSDVLGGCQLGPLSVSKSSRKTLLEGAVGGLWHSAVSSLIGNLMSNNICQSYATAIMESVAIRRGNGVGLDETDHSQIQDLYSRYEKTNSKINAPVARNESDTIPATEQARAQIRIQRERRKIAVSKSLPLLDPVFDKIGLVLPPGLTLMGNESGKGKSTTVINMISEIHRRRLETKGFVVTAEVASEDYYAGVAANLEGMDFLRYRAGKLSEAQNQVIEDRADSIPEWLRVVGHAEIPDIQDPVVAIKTMREAVVQGFDYIIIDYYQRINSSDKDSIQTIKKFGDELNRFSSESLVPVVVMVQLNPHNPDFPVDISQRIQQDRHIFNHAELVIEMNSEMDANRVRFVVRKSRFAKYENKDIWLVYRDGRLIFDKAACYVTF